MSGNSWSNMGQECIKCHINVFPHKQVWYQMWNSITGHFYYLEVLSKGQISLESTLSFVGP